MDRIQNHRSNTVTDVYDRYSYSVEDQRIMESTAGRIMQLAEGGPENVLAFKRAI
jgi:hypothetical protein